MLVNTLRKVQVTCLLFFAVMKCCGPNNARNLIIGLFVITRIKPRAHLRKLSRTKPQFRAREIDQILAYVLAILSLDNNSH